MPHWILKWGLQRTISVLPRRQKFNEVFQKYFTRTLHLGASMVERRLEHCRIHLENYRSFGTQTGEFRALEIGAGWFPTIAVGLYLCGAKEVWIWDIDRLLKPERLARMMEHFCAFHDEKKLKNCLPALDEVRFEQLRDARRHLAKESAEQWLSRFNIHVNLGDARATGLPDRSVDLIYSTSVLEYIEEDVLLGLFKEFRRLGSSHAVMSHWIGLLDQYSFFDKSLSPFNNLKYTEGQWKIWRSPLTPQTRLMIPEYRRLFAETGFEVVKEMPMMGSDEQFDRVKIAPQFQKYPREELMKLGSWMVCKPSKQHQIG